jgi:hypothetical protein
MSVVETFNAVQNRLSISKVRIFSTHNDNGYAIKGQSDKAATALK